MDIRLDRPIIFIDLETTGLNPAYDRIVEITAIKVHPDGSEEQRTVRINPEMRIPAAATSVHGITDEDVVNQPPSHATPRTYWPSLMDQILLDLTRYVSTCRCCAPSSPESESVSIWKAET